MANASLLISIKTARSQGDLARFIKDTSAPREQCRALENLFNRANSGIEALNFSVQTSINAPVQAASTYTITYGSLVSGTSAVTVAGVTLTAQTSPSGQSQWGIGANLAAATTNLANCINGNTSINTLVSASANTSTGVVTVTALTPGAVGNFIPTVGGTGIAAAHATLINGAGAAETVPVFYSKGL